MTLRGFGWLVMFYLFFFTITGIFSLVKCLQILCPLKKNFLFPFNWVLVLYVCQIQVLFHLSLFPTFPFSYMSSQEKLFLILMSFTLLFYGSSFHCSKKNLLNPMPYKFFLMLTTSFKTLKCILKFRINFKLTFVHILRNAFKLVFLTYGYPVVLVPLVSFLFSFCKCLECLLIIFIVEVSACT